MQLVIGNKNYSSWSMRPWLLLQKSGLAFEEKRIALFDGNYKQAILDHSGAGKVPVLVDEDVTVWDSLAICEYISDVYMQGEGWPVNPNERAIARSASAEMHAGFFALREQMPMNCRATNRIVAITEPLRIDIERIDALWSSLRERFATEGPWLMGHFSIVDCMYAPVALRFNTYNVPLSEAAKAYVDVIINDPDVKLWVSQAAEESETIAMAEKGKA